MTLAAGHDLADAVLFGRLAVLDLDQADAVEVLHQGGGEVGGLDHGPGGGLAHPLAEAAQDQGDQGRAQQDDRGQPPVGPGHIGDHRGQGQGVLGIVDHAVGEGLAHQIGVEQHRGDETARVLAAQPGEVGADHGTEQPDLDVADDAVTQPVDEGGLTEGGGGPDQARADDDQGDPDQGAARRHGDDAPDGDCLAEEEAVDGRLQQLQHRGGHDPDHGGAGDRGEQRGAVVREIVAPDTAQQGAQAFLSGLLLISGGDRRRHRSEVGRDGGEVKRGGVQSSRC